MKTLILLPCFLTGMAAFSQTPGTIQLFYNKEAKVRSHNLNKVELSDNGAIELTAFIKPKRAEKITFGPNLTLIKREELDFDFDADEKAIGGRFFDYTYNKTQVIKEDVLEVASADVVSKAVGMNFISKGKVGLKNGGPFKIQKGDIKLVQMESQTTNYYGSAGSVTGGSNSVATYFSVKEELKLKSEEDKSLLYEFHSSKGEYIQDKMDAILFKMLTDMSRKGGDHKKDADYQTDAKEFKALTDAEADLLVIAKRKSIYKFGKAPSEADMLPEYYAIQFSPKTMDEISHTKFAEPVSREIIYRESLKEHEGVILVSAPTTYFKPKDENSRNYVFRLVGNDAKLKFEFNHTVPSGFTMFSNAIEMPDGSIVLIAGFNGKKIDKYFNQYVTPFNRNTVYLLTIKDGKITHEETIDEALWTSTFRIPEGSEAKGAVYAPEIELTENVATEKLANGGLLSFWSVTSTDPKGLPIYLGDVALQFSKEGKLETKYWVACKEQSLKRATKTLVVRENEHEFYWVTFEPVYQKEETRVVKSVSMNVMAGYANPVITKLNTQTKVLSKKTLVGDEKHVIGESFPYLLIENGIQFFGFDKAGKEFWTQSVVLD